MYASVSRIPSRTRAAALSSRSPSSFAATACALAWAASRSSWACTALSMAATSFSRSRGTAVNTSR